MANYPWDGNAAMVTQYEGSPDDAAFRHLASVYARAHKDMAASAEFVGGITNGAAWYPVRGGMQVRPGDRVLRQGIVTGYCARAATRGCFVAGIARVLVKAGHLA